MKRGSMLCLVMGMAALLAGCHATAQSGDLPQIGTTVTERKIEAFGRVKSAQSQNIVMDIPCVVSTVHVKEGQTVQKGDVLATINLDEYDALIKTKEMQLSAEKKVLARLEKELIEKKDILALGQDPDMIKLQNDLTNAKNNHTQLLFELDRKTKLFLAGSATQNEVEHFQKNADAAEIRIHEIALSIDSLAYGRTQEIKHLEAQTQDRKYNNTLMQRDLQLMKEKAEKDFLLNGNILCTMENAIIEGIFASNGDMLAPAMKLFQLVNLDTLYVEARIPEEFIKDAEIGMKAYVIPLADKNRRYQGTISRIANKAQQRNGETNVLVEILLDEENDFLLLDFNVNVEIPH